MLLPHLEDALARHRVARERHAHRHVGEALRREVARRLLGEINLVSDVQVLIAHVPAGDSHLGGPLFADARGCERGQGAFCRRRSAAERLRGREKRTSAAVNHQTIEV